MGGVYHNLSVCLSVGRNPTQTPTPSADAKNNEKEEEGSEI